MLAGPGFVAMTDVPDDPPLAAAALRLALLNDQAAVVRAELARLHTELAAAQRDFGAARAVHLVEANERLVLAALHAETVAETAVSELDEAVRDNERDAQREARLQESRKMESIGVLAGGIAHDFNNVLAGILGNVALAQRDLAPDHPAMLSLAQIQKASLYGRELVQQILAFARRQPKELADWTLSPLVEETVDLLRATLPASVTLDVTLADEPLHVLGDATQIEQVLMNLCTNAWHALDGKEGWVSIGLKPVALSEADGQRIGNLSSGRYAYLSVTDSGTGMDAETRSRIFEPFFTTKEVGKGTGLGLSVAHGIVTAHGGAITVDSAKGGGSRFDIYLPLHKSPAQAAGSAEKTALPTGHGEHVLYVDDDEVMVLVVERFLHSLGYRVTCCLSPVEALKAVRDTPYAFDVVITDLNMPELTGLDVAREVCAIRPDLAVMISSGNIPEQLHIEARQVGVRALMHKQNTLDDLAALLRLVLSGATQVHQA